MGNSVVSGDGTILGFETLGAGPPLVLVHGAGADRHRWAPVRERLAERYRVHVLDRRGRGLSADEALEYSIWREAEDIAAVAESLGGGVYVVAHSYGALCSLHAAQITAAIGRLVAYEPPRPKPGEWVVAPDAVARMRAATDPEEILSIFMREALRLPESTVDEMKGTPVWEARLGAAHTIARELECVEAFVVDDKLAKISVPVRLFVGTESPEYLRLAAAAVAERVPGADSVPMVGQAHQAMDFDPEQFVAAVFAFGEA